jgi:HEAT repeat protein/beta-lactamase regulating signal transducer with metallopeptidase domain
MFTPALLSTLFSGSDWMPLADAIAKATILLAAAGLVSFALRHASAAARHLVWTLALTSALVLPVLSFALPRWQLTIVTLETPAATPAVVDTPSAIRIGRPENRHYNSSQAATSHKASSSRGLSNDTVSAGAVSGSLVPSAFSSVRLSWPAILLMIWSVGALAILARVAAGLFAVQWMSRRTHRVIDAPWLGLAKALATELGISPRIRFLRSHRATMPMAWGLWRPAVLMPADADTWPVERLRIVLLHELAHVKRRDCLTHMVAQIACALYWFNPLAWVAAKQVRTERERACDDLVLVAGTRGPDYADQLLEIARVMGSTRFPSVLAGASLAMAHRSQLEGRLMAILDPTVPRSGMTRVRTAVASMVAACALMPLASLQPWAYAAENGAAVDLVVQVPAPTPRPDPTPTPAPSASAGAEVAAPSPSEPVDQRGDRRNRHSNVDDINTHVDTNIHSRVNTDVHTNVETNINQLLNSNINTIVNSSINALVNSNVNASVNAHAGRRAGHDDAQDATGKGADPRMVAALTAALKDTDKDVRETALHALVQLRDPSVFEPLVQALKDAAADVREQAAFGLGQLRDRRAVEPLAAALKDAAADVREQAAFALGQIRDRAAVAPLAGALKDVSDDVREQVVFALGQLRDPSAIGGLTIALHDAKPDVRQQAAFSLGQIRDPKSVEPLISALKDSNGEVREQAAFALGQIRDRAAVEALVIALKDSDADVREQAAFALGQIRDPRAIDGLTGALKDPSADVRQQAAFALGQLARSR